MHLFSGKFCPCHQRRTGRTHRARGVLASIEVQWPVYVFSHSYVMSERIHWTGSVTWIIVSRMRCGVFLRPSLVIRRVIYGAHESLNYCERLGERRTLASVLPEVQLAPGAFPLVLLCFWSLNRHKCQVVMDGGTRGYPMPVLKHGLSTPVSRPDSIFSQR